MTSEQTPEIATVDFHTQKIITIRQDGIEYVAMRPIVEAIGLEWRGQSEKLRKNREKFSCVDIYTTGKDGKKYKMLCIPLTKLNGFLFTINPEKIPDLQVRKRVELYQAECFIVLHNYWHRGEAINPRKADVIIEEPQDPWNHPMMIESSEYIELLRFKIRTLEKEKEDARKRVTEDERELIVKLHVQRYAPHEIAKMTGRKAGTVRTVIRRHMGGAI